MDSRRVDARRPRLHRLPSPAIARVKCLRDTHRAMSEDSTNPDLVERMWRRVDAADSGDTDAMTSFFASDAVWDSSPMGMEVFEGRAAIRRFLEDWWGDYEVSGAKAEEVLDLGNDV